MGCKTPLFQKNRRLSEFSTFGIGGPIRYFLEIRSLKEMEEAFFFIREEKLPFLILGKGSNSLFPDEGFNGVALLNKIDFCKFRGDHVEVGAGYSFSLLGIQTAKRGLAGLEFASGIPASVGGAVYMNAGANGKETFMPIASIGYLSISGAFKEYKKGELSYSYRSSCFQKMEGAIIFATFDLSPSESARETQLKIVEYRMKTQPLREKSAGCIFQNPSKELGAGALIDRLGLKGAQVGGAKVSELHANFIVNTGGATAADVKELIAKIQKKVFEETKILLEPEVKIFS